MCLLTADDLACGNVLYPTSFIPRRFGSTECKDLVLAYPVSYVLTITIGPLFTAYASHVDSLEEYVYLGSAEGALYKLQIDVTSEIHWIPIEKTNPISQSMCILGTIDMTEQGSHDTMIKADVLLYAGESADNEVIAVSITPKNANSEIDLSFYCRYQTSIIKHVLLLPSILYYRH